MKKLLSVIALLVIIPTLAFASWGSRVDTNIENTMAREGALTEVQQRKYLLKPLPTFENSLERQNLTKRLEIFNKSEKVSYIYLTSFGKVMAFYTVKGKVSSVNSMLTNTEQLVTRYGKQCASGSSSYECFAVPSPDLDGSYGSNGDAVFFFTTEGTYVEWNGEYMLADQPLKLTTQPELVRTIK